VNEHLLRHAAQEIIEYFHSDPGIDLFNKAIWLKILIAKSWFQPTLMLISGLFLYVVVLTTLFGTQMSGRNLGVMLVWIVWLFTIIFILTPLNGRIWCTVCPIPLVGEFLQRLAITRVRAGSTNGSTITFLD